MRPPGIPGGLIAFEVGPQTPRSRRRELRCDFHAGGSCGVIFTSEVSCGVAVRRVSGTTEWRRSTGWFTTQARRTPRKGVTLGATRFSSPVDLLVLDIFCPDYILFIGL